MLNIRISKNVQDIRWSHEVYQKQQEKLEIRTDSKRKKLRWGEMCHANNEKQETSIWRKEQKYQIKIKSDDSEK